MTLTHFLLGAAWLCSGYLMVFAAMYAAALLVFLTIPRDRRRFAQDDSPVAVLVPSLDEGAALVDCARSLLAQDHAGHVSARLLVQGENDSSVAPLLAAFPAATPEGREVVLERRPGRDLRLVYTGLTGKASKLNAALADAREPYVAFLDADHLAHRTWLRSSVCLLQETGCAVVQSRRWPVSVAGAFRLWDSLQHHAGVQVLSFVYRRLGLDTQFTGTTAVFRREALEGRRFDEASLTEDTDLFYRMMLEGERVAYNPYSGSSEDLSPDLFSFVARRRRWSHGHTEGFLKRLPRLRASKARLRAKLHFLLHGQFYLATLAIVALHALVGAYFFLQASARTRWAAAAASVLASAWLARTLRTSGPRDFVAGLLWTMPVAALAAVLGMKLAGDASWRYLIPFPHERAFAVLCAAGIGAPLALIAGGALRLGTMSFAHLLLAIACFPLILFLDVHACLLGLADAALGARRWSAIRRSDAAAVGAQVSGFEGRPIPQLLRVRPASVAWAAVLLVMPPMLAHDYAYYRTCGKAAPLLERPFFDLHSAPVEFYTWTDKRKDGPDGVSVGITAEVIQSKPERNISVVFSVDGRPIGSHEVKGDYQLVTSRARFPLGWETRELTARVDGKGFTCESIERVSTDLKEVSGRSLLVNGEPFLVKGIVPSFMHPSMSIPLERGYRMIRELGANAIRIYHAPTPEIRKAAAGERLLVIDQPEASTWDNVDLARRGSRQALRKRFHDLRDENRDFPYALVHEAGNELELGAPRPSYAQPLDEILRGLEALPGGEAPGSYATNRIDPKLTTAIRSVNMLDTGRHYWEKGVALAAAQPQPLLASEFGGFLGGSEVVPGWYRAHRFAREWRRLLDAGAVGGVFFESHDNWAQPQFKRITDPFSPDAPDDQRGIWDHEGRARPEAEIVRAMFSDVEAAPAGKALRVRNRRAYWLRGVTAAGWESGGSLRVGDLAPGARRAVALAGRAWPRGGLVSFEYTTHRGLRGYSGVRLPAPPPPARELAVLDLQASRDGRRWEPLESLRRADGPLRLRFRVPAYGGGEALLVLSGLRARRVRLSSASGKTVERAPGDDLPYQEVLFDLRDFGPEPGVLEASFTRELAREAYGAEIEVALPVVAARGAGEPGS